VAKDLNIQLPGAGKQKPEGVENRALREKVKKLEAEVELLKMCRRTLPATTGKESVD